MPMILNVECPNLREIFFLSIPTQSGDFTNLDPSSCTQAEQIATYDQSSSIPRPLSTDWKAARPRHEIYLTQLKISKTSLLKSATR